MDFNQILCDFKSAGFKQHKNSFDHENAECLLQKRVYDEDQYKTKYFVNIYPYNMTLLGHLHQSFQLDCYFKRSGQSFNFSCTVESPEQAESLAEEFWTKFNCDYYE